MSRFTTFVATAALIGTALLPPAPALAQTGLDDLIGVRGSSAEGALASRGYVLSGNKGGASMWWNGSSRRCVSMYVDDGRVESIQPTSPADCGHGSSGGGRGNGAVAGALIGALLIGAIAASANKHHDRDDDRTFSPADGVQCYPRQYQCYAYGDFSAKWTRRVYGN